MAALCKKCLLREMAETDVHMIEKYKAAIKTEDRVAPQRYEERLDICKACEHLLTGTCQVCGCYVELRALGAVSHCPKHCW
jgi:hypothetical protein